MDTRDRSFFQGLINDERMLHNHGFDGWPNDEELARYACDLEDGLQALANAFDVELAKDIMGRWQVIPKKGGRCRWPAPSRALRRTNWCRTPMRNSITS